MHSAVNYLPQAHKRNVFTQRYLSEFESFMGNDTTTIDTFELPFSYLGPGLMAQAHQCPDRIKPIHVGPPR